MNKREFIRTSLLAGAGLTIASNALGETSARKRKNKGIKHWVWERPNSESTEKELTEKYKKYAQAGIGGVFFEGDSEIHFRTARKAGLEAHFWMWTMNRGEKNLLDAHPEYYAINRLGESCATHPPYVDYYRWLCPSKPEVRTYLEDQVKSVLKKKYVDGIHLDYVRYCDVILPVNLWERYGIEQTQELADYDFCYCESCRSDYKAQYGQDPLELDYPDQSPSWRKFRYEKVNDIVNHLANVARDNKKPISAAVFPTPEIARRIVRQDWTKWNLDAVFPMIYHSFYQEQVSWIGDAVEEGVHFLNGRQPLYAGLFLPDFKSEHELAQAVGLAMRNGAAGISLFGDVSDEVLGVLRRMKNEE